MAELNTNYGTGSADFGNTLLKAMTIKHLQSQSAENEMQNTVRAIQAQKEHMQYQKELLDWGRNSLAIIDPGEYGNWRKTYLAYGASPTVVPEESTFMEKGEDGALKFNAERWNKWRTGAIKTASQVADGKAQDVEALTLYGPEGKTLRHYQKRGELFDPASVYGSGWTLEKPAAKSESFDTFTLYGPKGQTKRVSVPKGEGYTPEAGWSIKAPEAPQRESWHATGSVDEETGKPILVSNFGKSKLGDFKAGAKPKAEKQVDIDRLNSTIAMNNDNFAAVATHVDNFNKTAESANFSYWEGDQGGVVKIGYGVDSKGNQITNADIQAEAKRIGKSFGEVVGQLQKRGMAQYVEMPKPKK